MKTNLLNFVNIAALKGPIKQLEQIRLFLDIFCFWKPNNITILHLKGHLDAES